MSEMRHIKSKKPPVLFMSDAARQKVESIVRLSDKEVGWLGRVEMGEYKSGQRWIELKDCYVPKQEVTAAACDIDPEGVADYVNKLIDEGHDPQNMLWWGHSHVNMTVGPSGTDMETFNEFIENLAPGVPFIMTIHNNKKDVKCNLYLGDGYYLDGVHIESIEDTTKLDKVISKELKENVREKIYASPVTQPYQTSWNHTHERAVPNSGATSGVWSNRLEPNPTIGANGNARHNAMGLR